MFNKLNLHKNECMLTGSFKRKGYDWWWHSFTAVSDETGEEVPFFVEYFLVNPECYKDKSLPVLGQSEESLKNHLKPSYLMVKAGCWGKNKKQLHRFFAWNDVQLKYGAPYSVKAMDCEAGETFLKGSICVSQEDAKNKPELMSDSGEISWELKLQKVTAFNVGYGTSFLFRFLKAFQMYWHAQGMKTLVEGKILMDGKSYSVKPESSYGYSDKNWGSGFTSPWVWIASSDLTSEISGKKLEDSAFDIGGGKPRVFGIPLNRKLLSAFWYEGKPYEFNFSKFWTCTKTIFDCVESKTEILWHIEQSTLRSRMVTDIACSKADMLFVNYEDPQGIKRFSRLWNGGNGHGTVKLYKKQKSQWVLIDSIKTGHVGCEYGEFDK